MPFYQRKDTGNAKSADNKRLMVNMNHSKGKKHRMDYIKEYQKNSKYKYYKKQYMKEYYQRPEIKQRQKEYMKEYIKKYHIGKYFGLTVEQYLEKIKDGCIICGFKEVVDLHHKNGRKDNSDLVCLCPNHHALIHRKHITFESLYKI